MLRCDGEVATLSMCSGVALNRGQYVRVAGKLYEKVWAHRFKGRSRRFMLDPAFVIRVLKMKNSKELDRVTRVFSSQMFGLTPNLINVVFVPVVLNNHWWCVAFSLNQEEILKMDSIETSTAADLHWLHVKQLMKRSYKMMKNLPHLPQQIKWS
ncbi:uncharacterized protein LOC110735416 [Chenopodium quinoa]|uniref:uncharacterized protein LOC110735416 n=1 Tax=Chenopodium quinoa TaxID=63459 RepID=UPI000B77231D|nr:uncharacterized protein LOC110735416 [Chenopodium quinoa]